MVELAELEASRLRISPSTSPKPAILPNDAGILDQSITTDHLLTIEWDNKTGWSAPTIGPFRPLTIQPTASCLHYATECFEGLKVYRSPFDGKVRLFRPQLNAARFLRSAQRISLPGFDTEEFLKLLTMFVKLEAHKWLPDTPEWRGRFLYIRPAMIGTGHKIGLGRPEAALMFMLAVYMPDMTRPFPPQADLSVVAGVVQSDRKDMKLQASQQNAIRAWPGGVGFAKVGANYGPTLSAQVEASSKGYDQVLWLFGDADYVTEVGGANFFMLWKRKEDGVRELVTPPVGDGTILEGVTRRSVLDLASEWSKKETNDTEKLVVSERSIKMNQVVQALQEGRLLEAFAVGTTVFIKSISEIEYRGRTLTIPLGETSTTSFGQRLQQSLEDIMYGKIQHEWGVVVD